MAKVSKKEFARYVKEHRTELGLTQQELAEILCVSTDVVSKWERGVRFPDFEMLEPLATALGVTVQQLVDGSHSTGEEINRVAIFSTIGAIAVALIATMVILITRNNTPISVVDNPTSESVVDNEVVSLEQLIGVYVCHNAFGFGGEDAYLTVLSNVIIDEGSYSTSRITEYIPESISDNVIRVKYNNDCIEIMEDRSLKLNGRVYEKESTYAQKVLGTAILTNNGILVDIDNIGLTVLSNYYTQNEYLLNTTDGVQITTGDRVNVFIGEIEETYPARTICYSIEKTGEHESYNKDLSDLGYTVIYATEGAVKLGKGK